MPVIRYVTARALAPVRKRHSVIIGYHGIGLVNPIHDPHNLVVSPTRLRNQISVLRDAGYSFVTVAEMASHLQRTGDAHPPAGLAALSFDDGMEDNYSVLLPILQEFSIPATVYVTTGLIGKPNPWLHPDAGARMMTADELVGLARAGIEIGGHTVSHADLSQLNRSACLAEIRDSVATVHEITGKPVHTFAYPFGRYSQATLEVMRSTGLLAGVTCEHRGNWSPFEVKRPIITGKDRMPSFLLKVSGAYYPIYESRGRRAVRSIARTVRSCAV